MAKQADQITTIFSLSLEHINKLHKKICVGLKKKGKMEKKFKLAPGLTDSSALHANSTIHSPRLLKGESAKKPTAKYRQQTNTRTYRQNINT